MAATNPTKSKKARAKTSANANESSKKQKAPATKAKAAAAKAKSNAAQTKTAKPLEQADSSILQPLVNLRRQIDEMLNETIGRLPHFQLPRIEWPLFAQREADTEIAKFDFSENEKAVTVIAEIPGMTSDDVEVTLQDGVLTIKGEKKSKREEKGENFYLSERKFGSFSRAFRLPDGVKEDEIAADFKKGILTVTLPKAVKAKKAARRVSVKTS